MFLSIFEDNICGERICTGIFRIEKQTILPAYLLMYDLFKLLIVQDCPHLPIAVTSPVRSDYLHIRVTNIPPKKHGADYQLSTDKLSILLDPAHSTGGNIW